MDIAELVLANRSTRRFHQEISVSREFLLELIDLARQSASSKNLQPLKFYLCWEPEQNERIFPLVKWAGYIPDWPGPEDGERPAAYIIILGDRNISDNFCKDTGIAAQTILLGAVERGMNGCMLGSFKDSEVRSVLSLPDELETQLIVALGVSAEESRLEEMNEEGNILYWRDENEIFHVPKRHLDEILLN